jgi:lipoate-protein ligase A
MREIVARDTWRLIVSGKGSAPFNMALDEALAFSVRQGRHLPTLRFYEWDTLSVTLGYFQKYDEVNTDFCQKKDIPVIRRLTGGRAVLHGKDLTYSFSTGDNDLTFGSSISLNYQKLSAAFLSGFKKLGLNAFMTQRKAKRDALRNPSCFKSVSLAEITVEGKKIVGSAQKRWSDGMLQQGSVMVDFDPSVMCEIFYHKNTDMISDIGRIKDYTSSVTVSQITEALIRAFEETFDREFVNAEPDSYEYDMAKNLELQKYSSSQWNLIRGNKDEYMMKVLKHI